MRILTKVLGPPQFYCIENCPLRIWLIWGAMKDGYPSHDNVQFGMRIRAAAISKVVKLLTQYGISEEKR